ncbi:winged helix-turn-helix domain-containing protein [Methanobrevibacter sp.]|uniref:winged helix-turn-helix domain-containing protein n=1 Tax=Methanobrevibacter sp. TaxID=66852 RepID=UPI0025F6C677|nr:winged helix-turn-helix domain-containing protein [Methanobrevibacter sp.]MBQ2962835.1 winged helix-turn-helix domain-containing protein [Methanobrevibacter sp.]
MAIPDTYDLVLPLLEIIKDKDEYKVSEIMDEVIDFIDISDEDKEIRLPNNEPVINSRISTANTYLKKAELIESNRFMYFNITEEGLNVLADEPEKITEEDLMEYGGFKDYKKIFIHDEEDRSIDLDDPELNPTKALRESFAKQMEDVKKEIEEEMKEENKKSSNRKYFQSKEYEDSDKVFGIKANRDKKDDDDKYSKCHDKKHKHHKDKCKCHHKHKKIVLNIEFSPAEELLKYAELLEKGYLTKEEFEKKKEELLNIEYKI